MSQSSIISDWFLEHDNESTLLKWPPLSPDLNPIEHFGMWWNGKFASWMFSRQNCSNCVMLSCQYGPKSLRNVSNTLLNICHEELTQFWRQKGVQHGTSKVYLIKWPVSVVYITIHFILFWPYAYQKLNQMVSLGLWIKLSCFFLYHFTCIILYKASEPDISNKIIKKD